MPDMSLAEAWRALFPHSRMPRNWLDTQPDDRPKQAAGPFNLTVTEAMLERVTPDPLAFVHFAEHIMLEAELEKFFTYHSPKGDQPERYVAIRNAGYNLALTILRSTSPSADQTAAIRKVREAVMTANAAIAIGEA